MSRLTSFLGIFAWVTVLTACANPAVPAPTWARPPTEAGPTLISDKVVLTATVTPVATSTYEPLPACPGDRIAFQKSGPDYVHPGIVVSCPETEASLLVLERQQVPAGTLRLHDIARDGNALLINTSDLSWTPQFKNDFVSLNLIDHSLTTLMSHSDGSIIQNPQWSPDGQFIGYVSNSIEPHSNARLEFIHIPTQTVSTITHPTTEKGIGLIFNWSGDGDRALYYAVGGAPGSDGNGVYALEVNCDSQTGSCTGTHNRPLGNTGGDASLSYDGALSVGYWEDAEHPRGYIEIANWQGEVVQRIALHDLNPDLGFLADPHFSPDSKRVAFVAENLSTHVRNIYILDLATMNLTSLTNNLSREVDYGDIVW